VKVKLIMLGLFGFGLIASYLACTDIKPYEQGIILQKSPKLVAPGFYITLPLITNIKKVDMRAQSTSIASIIITTQDKVKLDVDLTVIWKIADLATFAKVTQLNNAKVTSMLQASLATALSQKLSNQTMAQILGQPSNSLAPQLMASLNSIAQQLGIQIIDVNIQNLNFTPDGLKQVYQNMQASSQQEVALINAQGKQQLADITAQAKSAAQAVTNNARIQAASIKGQGEAQAQLIYNKAYAKDPKFFTFWRGLQLYQQLFTSNQAVFVLKPDGQFLQYLNNYKPK